jgi:hypothetical protein
MRNLLDGLKKTKQQHNNNNNNTVIKCVLFVSVHKILAEKYDGKRPRASPRHVWQASVKINN